MCSSDLRLLTPALAAFFQPVGSLKPLCKASPAVIAFPPGALRPPGHRHPAPCWRQPAATTSFRFASEVRKTAFAARGQSAFRVKAGSASLPQHAL